MAFFDDLKQGICDVTKTVCEKKKKICVKSADLFRINQVGRRRILQSLF